jgi:alpha-ketoglutarate-dependent taurine dioxygenase
MKITPQESGLPGARVTDIDLRGLKPANVHPLKVALTEHAVLVFRDQSLTGEEFIALGEKLDPLQCSIQNQWYHPQHPENYAAIQYYRKWSCDRCLARPYICGHDRCPKRQPWC